MEHFRILRVLWNLNSCQEGLDWVRFFSGNEPTPRQIWDRCERPEWLFFVMFRLHLGRFCANLPCGTAWTNLSNRQKCKVIRDLVPFEEVLRGFEALARSYHRAPL